jgi:hypothetical protein
VPGSDIAWSVVAAVGFVSFTTSVYLSGVWRPEISSAFSSVYSFTPSMSPQYELA